MTAPRLARGLIRIAAPADRVDELLGDLEEVHRRRRAGGSALASAASVADALIVASVLAGGRVRDMPGNAYWMITGHVRSGRNLARQAPLMTLTATAALALGIGLLTVGVATVETLLFSRLPFAGGDRFVLIRPMNTREGRPVPLAPEAYSAIASSTSALAHLGAASQSRENVTLPSGRVEAVIAAGITPTTLGFLPFAPLRGRPLIPADAEPGAEPVLVIREAFRKRAFGGDEDAVGATLEVGGVAHTVVGVMPDEFEFPNRPPDFWTPIDEGFGDGRAGLPPSARLIGILAPGHSLESAQAELDVLGARIRPAREADEPVRLEAVSMTDLGPMAPVIASALIVIVAAVLVVVAANVANLVLARSFARSRELAVRAALGASRARLVAQITGEVLFLCGIAGVVGAIGAEAVLRRFNAIEDLPFWMTFSVGPLTLMLVVCGTLVATAVAGAWPALKVTRGDLGAALSAGARASDASFGRIAGVIVVAQVAVSIVMLHGALVVADGVARYSGGGLGLPDDVLTAGLLLDPAMLAQESEVSLSIPDDVVEVASGVPGVIAAGMATALPRHSPPTALIEVEPLPGETPQAPRRAPSAEVSPGFFDVLDASLLAGRRLTPDDARPGAAPVAIVNAPFVEKFLNGDYPVGRRLRVIDAAGSGEWREIVGVVPDLGLSVGDPSLAAGYYVPLAEDADTRFLHLAVRVSGSPLAYVEPLTRALYERDPALVLNQPQPLENVAGDDRTFFLWFSMALTGLGLVTLMLALTGVYAMMALIVTRRTREIGIRIALGATSRRIVRAIVGRAAWQVGFGALVGAALAFLSLDLRGVLVSRLPDGGAWTLPAVLALLVAAGMAATALPLRRAVRVQPSDALRAE